MPGGELALSAYGSQNVVLSGNPQITFFTSVFTQYKHFSSETITVPFDSVSTLFFDRSTIIRKILPRSGDLVSSLFFRIRLPPIYSKVYVPTGGDAFLDAIPYEFKWVPHVGARIIERASIQIGGQEIAWVDSDWILSQKFLDYPKPVGEKIDALLGYVPELVDPAQGIYAWVDVSGNTDYPTVVASSETVQNNRFSIPEYFLNIPLGFWFGDTAGQALPLIALSKHPVEIVLTLRPLQDLYTVVDVYSTESPQPRIKPRNQPDMRPAAFFLDAGMGSAPTDSWNYQPTLECKYIFLSLEERALLTLKPLTYTIRRINRYVFDGITTQTKLDISQQHGIASRIVWFARRPDVLAEKNDWENFTNWDNPYIAPRVDASGVPATFPNSGSNIVRSQRDIIRQATLLCGGQEIQAYKTSSFYTMVETYDRCIGPGFPGLHIMPFELFHSKIQPAGTLNMSLFNQIELQVDVFPPISGLEHSIYVYVETVNFLIIQGGYGGLQFAI